MWVRKVGHNGDPPDGVLSMGLPKCGIGFVCSSHGVWAAAAGCNQVYFILFGPWCSRAMVCRSPLPGVGELAMVVVRVQGAPQDRDCPPNPAHYSKTII